MAKTGTTRFNDTIEYIRTISDDLAADITDTVGVGRVETLGKSSPLAGVSTCPRRKRSGDVHCGRCSYVNALIAPEFGRKFGRVRSRRRTSSVPNGEVTACDFGAQNQKLLFATEFARSWRLPMTRTM